MSTNSRSMPPSIPPSAAKETIQRLQNLLNKQALREAHQRLSILVDGNPLAVIGWNAAGEVVDWNPAAERLFGYAQAAAIGLPVQRLIAPSDPNQGDPIDLLQSRNRRPHHNLTQTGDIIYCVWHNFLQLTEGRLMGVISMVEDITQSERRRLEQQQAAQILHQTNQDLEIRVAERTVALQHIIRQLQQEITDRQTAQKALKQANAELEQRVAQRTIALQQVIARLESEIAEHRATEASLTRSEARFQKLADNIPGMIYQFQRHPDGRFSFPFVSLACRQIYGLEPAAVQADAMLLVETIPADDRLRFEQTMRQSAETQQTWHWSGRMQVGDRMKWIQGMAQPEPQLDGSIVWDGVLIDISPLKHSELALQTAKMALESRVATRTTQLQSVINQLQQQNRDRQAALQELKHVERKLRQSQQFLQLVIDSIPQMIFWKDRNSVYLGCNRNFARLAGVSQPAAILGKTDHDLTWTAMANYYRGTDVQVMGSQEPILQRIEPQLQADGTTTWIEISKIPLHDDPGDVIGILGSYIDITDRRRAEQSLQASEQQYRHLVETSQDVIWATDLEGFYTFVNPAVQRIYGYAPLAMRDRAFTDFLPAVELPRTRAVFQKLLQEKGSAFQYESTGLAQGGRVIHLSINAMIMQDEVGNIVGITGTSSDITDRKAAEAALRQSEATNRALLNAIPDLMIRMSRDGTYLDFRPAKTFTCLANGETANGKNLTAILPPQAAQRRLYHIEHALKTGEIQVYEYEMTIADQVHFEEARIVVSGENEVLAIVRDISDRKQAERDLEQSTQQLKQQTVYLETTLKELQRTQSQLVQSEKMSALGQLVAGIAHEINNPTGFIYGNLKHLEEYMGDLLTLITLYQQHYPQPVVGIQDCLAMTDLAFLRADLPKLLASMKFGAERIQQIVLSLRTFSRMDEADVKCVDIHSGIDSALLILDHRLNQQPSDAPIAVIKNYADLPQIECYAGELNQVVMNILVNAIDALETKAQNSGSRSAPKALEAVEPARPTHSQPLALTIQISTELLADDRMAIRIRDNGIGMSAAVKQHIFDPFFTTKPIGQGTGLGLATSYQIVTDRHGGTLRCHSIPGEGTEFIITIPLCQPARTLILDPCD